MKHIFFLMTLTLATSAFAGTFSCRSTVGMENTGTPRLITVKENDITFEGLGTRPILERVKTRVDGSAVKKCLAMKENSKLMGCLDKLTPDAPETYDSKRSLHSILTYTSDKEPGSEDVVKLLDVITKNDINIEQIAFGQVHVLAFDKYYPNIGVYEYFDANDRVLARFYHEILPRNCR